MKEDLICNQKHDTPPYKIFKGSKQYGNSLIFLHHNLGVDDRRTWRHDSRLTFAPTGDAGPSTWRGCWCGLREVGDGAYESEQRWSCRQRFAASNEEQRPTTDDEDWARRKEMKIFLEMIAISTDGRKLFLETFEISTSCCGRLREAKLWPQTLRSYIMTSSIALN